MRADQNELDRKNTEELFSFLQGEVQEGHVIVPAHMPKLTPEQAATVIWFLGNQDWQVTDHVERCEVCGDWYNEWSAGECLDFGHAPYHFCGSCCDGEEAQRKRRIGRKIEKAKART
jgi:hypothetical protein